MFRYYSSYILILSCFTHLLCCGIPILLGLSSLFSSLFYFELAFLDFELLEIFENYLFALTSLIFLMFICLEIYNKKIKPFIDNDCCQVEEDDSIKKTIRFNVIFSSILYIFNSFLFVSEKIY